MIGQESQEKLVSDSGLFDGDWYLKEYPDVAAVGIDPVKHYLGWGARMRRNPSPMFDTRFYMEQNADVAQSGINPLVHYIMYGRQERRLALPSPTLVREYVAKVDVVVTVFNALASVKDCLRSVARHRDGMSVRIVVVNDGSDADTTNWLRIFSAEHDFVTLVENPENLGYTRAVNAGLRASSAPHVVTLNSDTVVTSGWLRGMLRCMNSDPDIGIVGPLSNAASWQNVPRLHDESGQFAINDMDGLSVDEMAQVVSDASGRRYPKLPFVNGFCFMIDRRVLDVVGLMDEGGFPVGFGEENDYCIRAADAGFQLAIADDVFVFHAKSKSFGHDRRKRLSKSGMDSLCDKHSAEKVSHLLRQVERSVEMDFVRRDVRLALESRDSAVDPLDASSLKILFLLPVQGGGGGAHSVVQEASEMLRMNIDVKVAVSEDRIQDFVAQYPEIPGVRRLFIDISSSDILEVSGEFDVVVGTIYRSMKMVSEIVERHPHVLPAYYVQDYEPMFFPVGSPKWHEARESYTLVPNALLFAKTAWIVAKVKAEHGVEAVRVFPSIDHHVYYPEPREGSETIRIAAMIRPETPYRGAQRTMRVLKRLSEKYKRKVEFELFGCDASSELFQGLERRFPFVQHGKLTRSGVADLLRRCHLFVDLSDYQAFGRTALEAMACGCVSAVTQHGGTDEYAIDGVNALLLDSLDEDACFQRLSKFVDSPKEHWRFRLKGIETAAAYSVHRAAVSELAALVKEYARQGRRLPDRRNERVLGSTGHEEPSASGGRRRRGPHVIPGPGGQTAAVRASLEERYRELARLTRILMEREDSHREAVARAGHLEKENAMLAKRLKERDRRDGRVAFDGGKGC